MTKRKMEKERERDQYDSRWNGYMEMEMDRGYGTKGLTTPHSDVLHPNRANVSKDDLRGKLAELYKCTKEQVNVFGLQTQFGGGKTTGFALVYDSPEALKKFEPHFRLVRVGVASKIEKPSRQQRTSISGILVFCGCG